MTTSYAQQNSGTVTHLGKTYNLIKIGNQIWFKENLDVGIQIPTTTKQTDNNILEKYYYNNDTALGKINGGLYQWKEAMKYSNVEKAQGICPDGYHIPSYLELLTLINTVNDNVDALLKTGSNSSGFSALLSGFVSYGNSIQIDRASLIWSSSNLQTGVAATIMRQQYVMFWYIPILDGYSVRCLKDSLAVSVNEPETLPSNSSLSQNYPNPFNNETIIKYNIHTESHVTISVIDLLGRTVATLVDTKKSPGFYTTSFKSDNIPSGIYIYNIRTNSYTNSKKMMLLK